MGNCLSGTNLADDCGSKKTTSTKVCTSLTVNHAGPAGYTQQTRETFTNTTLIVTNELLYTTTNEPLVFTCINHSCAGIRWDRCIRWGFVIFHLIDQLLQASLVFDLEYQNHGKL